MNSGDLRTNSIVRADQLRITGGVLRAEMPTQPEFPYRQAGEPCATEMFGICWTGGL
jgi:hypothetical protein